MSNKTKAKKLRRQQEEEKKAKRVVGFVVAGLAIIACILLGVMIFG